jgi:hypothetical protein
MSIHFEFGVLLSNQLPFMIVFDILKTVTVILCRSLNGSGEEKNLKNLKLVAYASS